MASLFASGGLWDSAASSLFFSESGVDALLSSGGPSLTVEALLGCDSFIQDVQAQSPRLLSFLCAPAPLLRLLYYVSVPAAAGAGDDAAFRFPYFACEALCCGVRELLL